MHNFQDINNCSINNCRITIISARNVILLQFAWQVFSLINSAKSSLITRKKHLAWRQSWWRPSQYPAHSHPSRSKTPTSRVWPEGKFPAEIRNGSRIPEPEWHFKIPIPFEKKQNWDIKIPVHTGILTGFNRNLENICPFLTFMFKIHISPK